MDYEKKYNEALKRAEAAINIAADKDLVKGVATTIFPELRESEDERIRKHLIEIVETYWGTTNDPGKAADLAYLEKQKEQKPIPLMNGDADLYFDNWRQEKQGSPTKRQCFEEGMRYAQRLQKEHQNNSDAPNESSWSGIISSSHKDKNLDEIAQDYVDGVKEYNPEPTWDLMQTAVCYGYHYREGEEQKPAAEEILAKAGLKPYKDGNQWCILAGDNIQDGICGFGDTIDEALYEFLKEVLIMANSPQLKEQKPEEKPINWTELTWKDIDKLEGIINNVHYEFRNGIGQESFGKEVLEKFREYKGDEYLDEKEQKPVDYEAELKKCRDNPLYFYDKYVSIKLKPVEWSEEEYGRLFDIEHYLDGTLQLSPDRKIACIDFLKSLRPQPKAELTLLDENIIKAAVAFVEQNDHFNCWGGIDKHTVIKALRSIKPHWKPSEEQMDALRVTIDFMPDTFKQRCTLITLQNGLEKLMSL